MRWFVEVSRVGENSSDEKYCVEAKQWQAALQEARKLRGDSGPLSKFSIELLDDGYRAVDPKQKLRYVVAKAPQDAELSSVAPESAFRPEGPRINGQSAYPPSRAAGPSAAPAAPAPAVVAPAPAPVVAAVVAPAAPAPTPAVVAAAPAPVVAVAVVAPSPAPVAAPVPAAAAAAPAAPDVAPALVLPSFGGEPYAGVPSSALSPNALSGGRALNDAPAVAELPVGNKAQSAFPPRPDGAMRSPSAKPPEGINIPADVIPRAPALPQGFGIATLPQNLTQPSAAVDMPPPSTILRKRQEEPTTESPITYREVAYVVDPGVSRGSVEALLWASFRDLSRELSSRSGQKFVQLAVFDHNFDKRPERAPLGTLAWKDWRGNPVLSFPFFDGTPPAKITVPPPSIVPVPVVRVSGSSAPPPPKQPAASAAPVAPFASTPIMPLVMPGSSTGSLPSPAPAVTSASGAAAAEPVKSDPEASAIPR